MKKVFFLISLSIVVNYSCQSPSIAFQGDQNMNSGIARNNLMDGKSGYKIEGSPFIYVNYAKAEIENNTPNTFIRYNAMKDEVEVKEGANVYVLPKEEKFGKINILESGEKLRLVKYTIGKNSIEGYLFLLASNRDLQFYKKEQIILTKEKEAKNAYEENKPSKYQEQKPIYLLGANGRITEFPKNKKKLIELLPEKKDQIEAFFSKGNMNFSNEKDLLRLISIL